MTRRSLFASALSALVAGRVSAVRAALPRAPLVPVVISVRDFGAKGDGETDDSAAIWRAFYEAKRTGATLFFPPGEYVFKAGG